MLFKPELIAEILANHKHQTRRTIDDYEMVIDVHGNPGATDSPYFAAIDQIQTVMNKNGNIICEVGKTYAVCPGRGKLAVARIKIRKIHYERLRSISDTDLLSEGIDFTYVGADQKQIRRNSFIYLWNKLNNRKGQRWDDNPLVRVLTFELVK